MHRFVLMLLLIRSGTTLALAQDTPPALIVTLRDGTGAGVPGIAVVVTDRSGTTILARGTTESDGRIRFGPLPTTEVRVRVDGRLSDGTTLTLPGQDAAGFALTLGPPSVSLELRSEPDGTVRPDPASLTLEPGVAPDLVLTPFTAVTIPTILPATPAESTDPAILADVPDTPASPALPWFGLLLLAILLLALVGVLLLQRHGRHP